MMEPEELEHEDMKNGISLASRVMNALLDPIRPFFSKNAQKAYLGTFLFFATALCMIFVSTVAYGIFYYKFIPQVGVERAVHLQFGDGHPWGTARLGAGLISLQPYDVYIDLELPRTPSNLAAGNFMLDLALYPDPSTPTRPAANTTTLPISHSRRPAILSYSSPLVETSHKVSFMLFYILGWQREAERLVVPMMEQVEFARGRQNVPTNLRLEIHSREEMQIYKAKVAFQTRFTGLRWIMYHWRITSFFVFGFMFWAVSMTSASVVWILLALLFARQSGQDNIKTEDTWIKREPVDESLPRSSSSTDSHSSDDQPPPTPRIKRERDYEADEELEKPLYQEGGPSRVTGTGTGVESAEDSGIQRRRSRLFKEEHS